MSAFPSQIHREPLATAIKRIRLRAQDHTLAERIQRAHQVSPVAARILAARGLKDDADIENYLQPTLQKGLPNPNELKGLNAACKLLKEVIDQGQGIGICCDFDVDGLSGGSQVYHFLKSLNVPCDVYVPDRFVDGYGMNTAMVEQIAKDGHSALIAIDFGTTNVQELTRARELGLRTVVIDHHHVGEAGPPPADVFINPQQAGCNFAGGILCAAGLAWYLIVGLRAHLRERAAKIQPKDYLDLACLGTICDMVPLVGANRIIARRGLELLATTERVGLRSLKNVIGINGAVGCSHVSFGIGPRLNAAGRMVHGRLVVELLTSDDSRKTAKLARRLDRLNKQRQDTETQVKDLAIKKIEAAGILTPALVVWDKEFHTGVIGIVAQRLVEQYYRPAVVMGFDDGHFKGSVRGVKGFSVVEALASVSEHLVKFGGHDGAGGFSVKPEHVHDFADAFIAECERRLEGLPLSPISDADTESLLQEITPDLVAELRRFEPFGVGNPGPALLLKKLTVKEVRVLKNAHLKVLLSDGMRHITGLMWKTASHPDLVVNRVVDVVCKPDVNTFGGRLEMQAVIQAAQASGALSED